MRNLDDDVVKRLCVRAAEHGRSAKEEHREILRAALLNRERQAARADAALCLAEFRRRTAGRGGPSSAELLEVGVPVATDTVGELASGPFQAAMRRTRREVPVAARASLRT